MLLPPPFPPLQLIVRLDEGLTWEDVGPAVLLWSEETNSSLASVELLPGG